MNRPARIRVLGKQFSVVYGKDLPADLSGQCDSDKQRIDIWDCQPLESEQDTVLHEVLHAVDEAMGLKMREAQIRGVATGLLAIMKDNASFVSYLRRRK